jgi:endothelin-converting enzyme/putative endopeptidase
MDQASLPRADLRDPVATYNRVDLAGLSQLTGTLNFSAFVEAAGYAEMNDFNVAVPTFFRSLGSVRTSFGLPLSSLLCVSHGCHCQIIASESAAAWRVYLHWHAVHALSAALPSEIGDVEFEFFGRELLGQEQQQPRWRRCGMLICLFTAVHFFLSFLASETRI